MRLFEIILIGQGESVIETLLPPLPLVSVPMGGQNILRGQLSDQSTIMLYPILFEDTPSDAFIRKIISHASGIIISSTIEEGERWLQQHEFWQHYLTDEPVQPVVWVVPLAEAAPSVSPSVLQIPGGLILGGKSRMFFVQGNGEDVQRRIWRTLLMELLPVSLSEE